MGNRTLSQAPNRLAYDLFMTWKTGRNGWSWKKAHNLYAWNIFFHVFFTVKVIRFISLLVSILFSECLTPCYLFPCYLFC